MKLAIKLLAGSVVFNLIKISELWSRLGLALFIANRGAWNRPAVLGTWAVLIALTWRGSSWARNLSTSGLSPATIRWHPMQVRMVGMPGLGLTSAA